MDLNTGIVQRRQWQKKVIVKDNQILSAEMEGEIIASINKTKPMRK